MANSLGLDDDLDSVELVRDVEAAFEVRISDDQTAKMMKVGDLYDWLVGNMQAHCNGTKCASAMAFYRVRYAIGRMGFGPRLAQSAG